MSERLPTLEQIAADDLTREQLPYLSLVLARGLLALREQNAIYAWTFHALRERLDALEAPRSQGDAAVDQVDWKARAETAERERDERVQDLATQRFDLEGRIAERDALREALRKYGRHLYACPAQGTEVHACTCGLAAITAALDTGAS